MRGPAVLLLQDLHARAGARGEVRVALVERLGDETRAEEVRVEIVVRASVVVLRHAPLAARCATGFHDPFAVLQLVARAGVGVVDPVVEEARGRIRHVLGLSAARAVCAVHLLLQVGDTRALRVLHKPHHGRLRDEHAAIHAQDRARQDEAVGKDGALVHLPVAVRILEHDDAAERLVLALALDVLHVAAHFADKEASLFIPTLRNWRLDHRLSGDELDVETLRDFERLQLLLRGERLRRRELEFNLKCLRPRVLRMQRPCERACGERRGGEDAGSRAE